jgi:hypothetical protein
MFIGMKNAWRESCTDKRKTHTACYTLFFPSSLAFLGQFFEEETTRWNYAL